MPLRREKNLLKDGEIDGRDMEPVGVERDVVVLHKVAGQQTDEADEDFLDALEFLLTIIGIAMLIRYYNHKA